MNRYFKATAYVSIDTAEADQPLADGEPPLEQLKESFAEAHTIHFDENEGLGNPVGWTGTSIDWDTLQEIDELEFQGDVPPITVSTAGETTELLREVYRAVADGVESFELDDMVGPDLAYLLGAMLQGTQCQWPADRAVVRILRASFPEDHPVHRFIDIDEEPT
jgi:hypothetical protein